MKNKRTTKILSLVLVLVMALSLFPVSASAESYRGGSYGTTGWSSWWNWGWGGWWNPQPDPEPEPEEPAPVEEPVEDPAPVEEPIEEPAPVEEPVEDPAPEVEVSYPAVQLTSEEIDGLTVTVDAPEGALPEGTEMTVTPVSLTAVQGVVDSTDGVTGTVLAAADITFWFDGGEIQPNGEVSVTMTSTQLADAENTSVVHLDTTAADLETAEVEAEPVENVAAEAEAVTFDADHFSVYAVIGNGETGENARLNVVFYNGEQKIATILVKKADTLAANADKYPKVVYDPGTGTVANNELFKGWTLTQNYTKDSTTMDIAGVRAKIAERFADTANPVKEGEEFPVYAAIFKVFTITYLDEDGVSLGADNILLPRATQSTEYQINKAYVIGDSQQNFEGWLVASGSENIEGYTEGAIYSNETNVTLKGSIVLSANAPFGNWLVYHENKGTYNAPRFLKEGEVTVAPPLAMERNGYQFKGWYADEALTTPFTFGSTISTMTHVYAKWEPNLTAPYTVVIWKQNIDCDGYDFEESVSLTGNSNSTINTVTAQGTGDNAYARINNQDYKYTGFHLNTAKFDVQKTIAPEGNTVVHVYYDRTEYTLTFTGTTYKYTSTTSTSTYPTQYGLVNGQYVELTRHSSWGGGYYWTYGDDWFEEGPRYTGTRYTRTESTGTIKTITAKYQQKIADQFPIVGTDGTVYNGALWQSVNSSVFNNNAYVGYLDTMPAENTNFNLYSTSGAYTYYIKYYVEALPTDTNTVNFDGKKFVLYHTVTVNGSGLSSTESEEFTDIVGFAQYKSNPAYDSEGHADFDNNNTISLYYTRKTYTIHYMDGIYVNGDEKPVEETGLGDMGNSATELYGADISAYNQGGAKAYTPTRANYTFDGWYLDDACQVAADFDKMPEGGITVYAKWHQNQYRVFLHPDVPGDDTSLSWGTESQKMNFRRSVGDKVSLPDGIRDNYELVGWYLDKECTKVFNAENYILNDTSVTTAYDKTKDFTDPMDKWGNGATTNADVNRNWITKKLDIYASWRAKLEGANGIGVKYDANGGSNAPTDTTHYLDKANAIAQGASTAPSGQRFLYWVVQKWNGEAYEDTTTKVYPGDNFEVLKSLAKMSDVTYDDNGKIKTATYTMQLRAEYGRLDAAEDTHIYWYANNGTTDVVKDENLKINEAVTIKGADTFTYADHIFLGWAKKADATEDELFLKYENGEFKAKNDAGQWVVVTEVAADEILPYDDLYAVWVEGFYVYHSASNTVTIHPVTDTFDIYALTDSNLYYGGYYTACAGANDAQVKATADGATVTGGTPFTGAAGQEAYWTKADACTVNGRAMKPEAGKVYYLKEVPAEYLANAARYVYNEDTKAIDKFYLLTTIDDTNYTGAGYQIVSTDKSAKFTKVFSFQQHRSTSITKLYATDFNGVAYGYLGVVNITSMKEQLTGTSAELTPFWVTLDGIRVEGPARTLNFGNWTKDTVQVVTEP